MNEKIRQIILSQQSCVLATVSDGKPYCSLMAFIADEDCRSIYMVSKRNSRKFRNLQQDPWASLLIDNRDRTPDIEKQMALTVEGRFEIIESDEEKPALRTRFLDRHPYIDAFLDLPDAEIFRIRIKAFLLLDGLTDSHYETINGN